MSHHNNTLYPDVRQVWYVMVWLALGATFGMVWYGMVWFGMAGTGGKGDFLTLSPDYSTSAVVSPDISRRQFSGNGQKSRKWLKPQHTFILDGGMTGDIIVVKTPNTPKVSKDP